MASTLTVEEVLAMRLKEERRKAKLSQEELAERAGVSLSMISALERGERLPSLGMLALIAESMNVWPGNLLAIPGNVAFERPRYMTQFIEWMEANEVSHEEIEMLRATAKLLVQRRK